MKSNKKTILITGISTGIGATVANHFLVKGHTIVGLGRNSNEELENHPDFHFYKCDLTDLNEVKEVAKAIAGKYTISLFLHNAMFTPKHKPFLRYSAEELTNSHLVCSVAPTLICQRIVPGMRKLGSGNILFIGSAITQTGSKGQLAYLTAKSSLEGLTKGLALELAKSNISTNLLLLGPVKTEKFISNVSEENQNKILKSIPNGKLILPSEVASFVEYILNSESMIMNGASIPLTNAAHLRSFN